MGVLTLPVAPQQEEYPLKEKVKKPQGMGESGSNLNENIMLDIAKHRNGPLKSVPLHFRGDRIKFFGRDSKHK